jgi:hypothetical protein
MKSPALIGYVRAMTGIKTVIMGGDVVERGANRYLGLQEILCYANEMRSVCGKDFLVVHGNHDLNTPNVSTEDAPSYMVSYEESEKALFSHIDRCCEDVSAKLAAVDCTEEQKKEFLCYSRLHYYVDDENLKLRYIILDTGNPGLGRNGCVEKLFGVYNNAELVLQYDWLYETLMSIPEGWDAAVAGHALVGYGGNENIPGVTLRMCQLLSGYRTKSKITVTNPFSDNPKLTRYYAAGGHTYDFTGAKGSGNVAVIAADMHWDVQAKADYNENGEFVSTPYGGEPLSDTAIVVNVVQTDCVGCSRYEKAYPMMPGTKTEQCIEIVTICPDGNIKLTRIGAGNDRTVNVRRK